MRNIDPFSKASYAKGIQRANAEADERSGHRIANALERIADLLERQFGMLNNAPEVEGAENQETSPPVDLVK